MLIVIFPQHNVKRKAWYFVLSDSTHEESRGLSDDDDDDVSQLLVRFYFS